MKAFVDPELCIGCTQCAGLCPEVYQMEGTLAVAIPGDIPPDQVPLAVDAANACPVSAISRVKLPRKRLRGLSLSLFFLWAIRGIL